MADAATSALERIEMLLDPGSFVEIGATMTARSTDFNRDPAQGKNDGVITGHGLIDENLVFVFSQDATVLGGTLGEMHAKKICALYDMAKKVGAPVIGMLDSKGIRLLESSDAAEALGSVIGTMAKSSGIVPMISAVFGELGGGMTAIAGISDFTFIEENAHMFVTPPNGVEGVNKDKDKDDSSSATSQLKYTGVVDAMGTAEDIIAKMRKLVALLPGCAMEEGRIEPATDDLNRLLDASIKNADTETFVSALADEGEVFKIKEGYGKGMLTALIKLGGRTVGVIANNTDGKKSGKVCQVCLAKTARFTKFLDAFSIPILSVTDVCGYSNKLDAEYGLPLVMSELAINLANADVSKIALIRNAKSSAYLFLNSKALSADIVYAYADSKLEIMDSDIVAKAVADVTEESANEIKNRLDKEIFGADNAARRGYVDSIIDFIQTRKYLISGFEMLYTKTQLPYKKHEAR